MFIQKSRRKSLEETEILGKGSVYSGSVVIYQKKDSSFMSRDVRFVRKPRDSYKSTDKVTEKSDRDEWDNDAIVQRKVMRYKPNVMHPLNEDEQAFENFANIIDGILDGAYQEFVHGDFSGASKKYINLYCLRKKHFDEGVKDMHPSTAAGYVIESKVNDKICGWQGVELQATGMLKGTRPDIVLSDGNGSYGLLDITASDSTGHIFMKKGNWIRHENIIYVAELIYPSINFKTMEAITLTEEQEEAIRQNAETKRAEYEKWIDSCKENLYNNQGCILITLNMAHYILGRLIDRQKDRLIEKFQEFGIALFMGEKGVLLGKKMENFPGSDEYFEHYSAFDMNCKATRIIREIESNGLISGISFY